MRRSDSRPVVHLELHSGDPDGARAFYAALCGWRSERVEAGGASYLALALGRRLGGGIVECPAERALWLPYVGVSDVDAVTERARAAGATVLLEPRGGPAGRRSVVATPAGGELALWQPRR